MRRELGREGLRSVRLLPIKAHDRGYNDGALHVLIPGVAIIGRLGLGEKAVLRDPNGGHFWAIQVVMRANRDPTIEPGPDGLQKVNSVLQVEHLNKICPECSDQTGAGLAVHRSRMAQKWLRH